MGLVRSAAVILRKIDFSETSQVLVLFTRNRGKISAIARGSKRAKGSFQGPFDLLAVYDIVVVEKGEDRLDVIAEATLVEEFPRLREALPAFFSASYFCELLDEMMAEGAPMPALFDRFVACLRGVEKGEVPEAYWVLRFEAEALRLLGFFPRLLRCGGCEDRLGDPMILFSRRDGGALCPRCPPRDPAAWRVPRTALEILDALSREQRPPPEKVRVVQQELRTLLDRWVEHVLERRLKTPRFLRAE